MTRFDERTGYACIKGHPEMRAYAESKLCVGESTTGSLSVTGEKYFEFMTSASSLVIAETAMKAAFDEYAKDKTGTLYWRILPEYESWDEYNKIYMRLLISDKPAAGK